MFSPFFNSSFANKLKEIVDESTIALIYFLAVKYLSADVTRVCVGIFQTVLRLATDWTDRGSNPGGRDILRTRADRPWGPPSLL